MKPGDKVKITADEDYEGYLVPSPDDNIVIIKLESGYNLGIDKKKIKSSKVIEKAKEITIKKSKITQNKDLPTISILHTGGTIASKVDYKTGGTVPTFTSDDLIKMFPELLKFANINSRLVRNMWSQDMRFSHYNLIAKEIEKEIKKGTQGIIVTSGTDTLHYTSAALSFMLEDLPIPVLVVGSQRSSDRGSSDAAMNLLNAVYFMANSNFSEVGICMHNSSSDDYCAILPGHSSRKMHSTRRDAFKVINQDPIALVDYNKNDIKFNTKNYKKRNDTKLSVKLFDEKIKVAILKQFTNMYSEQYSFFEGYDGLVIESTGLGNLPITEKDELTKEHTKILKTLENLCKKTVVVLSPQTIFGRLNLNVYENARKQQEIGILGHLNSMTTETTFIKLAWLLSNYKKEEVKELILKDLRGELSIRTEFEEEFL